mgnify:CR=1 FL=1
MSETYKVEKEYNNARFDRWFKQKVLNIPQSLLEKLTRKSKIKINKKKIKTSYRVKTDDNVELFDLKNLKEAIRSNKIKYKPSKKEKSLYEDFIIEDNDNFLVINKPQGMPVQSGTKSFKNIIDILKDTKYFIDTKPFIVHRLDKETSGILIIAKNREYAQLFTSLFRIRKIHKTYIAVTQGSISNKINKLEDDLITYEKNKKIIQKAISNIKVLKKNSDYSLVELNPITGRKHQLRKQLYNIGNPIVGDDKYYIRKYNKINYKNNLLMLHAIKIKFMINNIKYNFKAKYNEKFEDFLKKNF